MGLCVLVFLLFHHPSSSLINPTTHTLNFRNELLNRNKRNTVTYTNGKVNNALRELTARFATVSDTKLQSNVLLYNSLTRKKEKFVALDSPKVSFYRLVL